VPELRQGLHGGGALPVNEGLEVALGREERLGEVLRHVAGAGDRHFDDLEHAPGVWAEYDDPVGEVNGLVEVVRDERTMVTST